MPSKNVHTPNHPGKREHKAARELALLISSGKPDYVTKEVQPEDPFMRGSSSVNTDLSRIAHMESEGKFDDDSEEHPNMCDVLGSETYWKLRDSFVEDAAKGKPFSLARVVLRAYLAGALSR